MADAFFFTELDPRARIKGSRDPLGAQAVWAGIGRELVGNLTTVTDSVRGFTTLLVGLYLAERTAERDHRVAPEGAFLVWEQLAGYARHVVHGESNLLGARRIAARAAAGTVTVSAGAQDQILANQKSYGLWGLYMSAARASGLVTTTTPPRLTPHAREVVERLYAPILESGWGRDMRRLEALLARAPQRVDTRAPDTGLKAVASLLSPTVRPDEARFYSRHLVEGGPGDATGGRQRRLAATMRQRTDEPISRAWVAGVAAAADDDVAARLRRIAAAESVLAPATVLFSYLLTRDDATLEDVGRDVADAWGGRLDSVAPNAAAVLRDQGGGDGRWADIAEGLAGGRYAATLRVLLDRNRHVMQERGGAAPWATLAEHGRLNVRFRDEPTALPNGDEIRVRWRFPYFLLSLHGVRTAVDQAL
jgi:hypothetical protein